MATQRQVEVFSAGCAVCEDVVALVKRMACASCVVVHDMHDIKAVARARALGVRSLPAVAIDGQLAGCCAGRGVDEVVLRVASRRPRPVLKRLAASVENFFPERFSARHRVIAPPMFATAVVATVLAMTFRLW